MAPKATAGVTLAPQSTTLDLDLVTLQQTIGEGLERDPLYALSQRKLNALGLAIAYIDREQRYRFANKAFLDWLGKEPNEVYGHQLSELLGSEVYEFYRAKLETALKGEPAGFECQLTRPGRPPVWIRVDYYPDRSPGGRVRGLLATYTDVDHLKRLEQEAVHREHQLRSFTNNLPEPVIYLDRELRYVFVNESFLHLMGLRYEDVIGKPTREVIGAEATMMLASSYERALRGEASTYERSIIDPRGRVRWIRGRIVPDLKSDGSVKGLYVVGHDITDLKQAQEALRRANWMLSSHISNTPLAVLEWDRDFRLVRWSPRAEQLFGWCVDEVLGMSIDGDQFVHESDRDTVVSLLHSLMNGKEPRATCLTKNYRKDRGTIWCEWYHSCLLDDDGRVVSILSFVQDVSARIQAEERLQYMATRDALTGLPNRLLLQDRLAQAIAHAKRSGRRVGVLFIDLDRFKNVNDTLGHRIGDELLKSVTTALSVSLRAVDLLARLGGDEFMVIVEDVDDPAALGLVAEKLQDAMARPFRIEEHQIYVTASIGISVYPDDTDDPEELLKHADVAMYRSKELGRNTYQFLDADVAYRRLKQHALESALRVALKEDALTLVYQPIVRVRDGAIVGAEALLRWNDPVHGDVLPRVFIPLAEESGLIHALGDWVLGSAAAQCAAWRDAGLALTVSVNLSPRQFSRDDLAQRMLKTVRSVGCDPTWIELEVTETSLLQDLDAIRKALCQLRDEGFAVAIDDFGTGYSSLTHLKHFPLDSLKIDISFIADLENDAGDAAITEAIIGLARGLGLRVVAEGVGTRAQLDFLQARGCDLVQGFWISNPLTPRGIEAYVQRGASVLGQKFDNNQR